MDSWIGTFLYRSPQIYLSSLAWALRPCLPKYTRWDKVSGRLDAKGVQLGAVQFNCATPMDMEAESWETLMVQWNKLSLCFFIVVIFHQSLRWGRHRDMQMFKRGEVGAAGNICAIWKRKSEPMCLGQPRNWFVSPRGRGLLPLDIASHACQIHIKFIQ